MRKILLSIFIAVSAVACKPENKTENKPVVKQNQSLPKFKTVREVLADASDFYEENGSLKFISEDQSNIKIQVSKPILEADPENVKQEIVKRDIVYVALQVFAQTDIDHLTITAIPNDAAQSNKYYENYRKTVSINRQQATQILKKYLGTEDFSILYTQQNGIWLPNSNFSKLKFEHLDEVFEDMSKS